MDRIDLIKRGMMRYINFFSDHPTWTLKQLTTIISDNLSRSSSSELIFHESKHQHEDALSKSSFKTELTYKDSPVPTNRKVINRKRNIICFNPPYN